MALKCEFDHCIQEYASGRPAHPPQVFRIMAEQFGPADGRGAIDIGAGTGLFTCGLADAGWQVAAVDASPVMLRRIPETERSIRRVCAVAERLPFPQAATDLVTVAQAFHWFNPPYALAEIARVLKPGGWLVLLWYRREVEASPFMADFEGLLADFNPKYRGEFARQDWAAKIGDTGAFEKITQAEFSHDWHVDLQTTVDYGRSLSYIRNTVSRKDMPRFVDRLRSLARQHFQEGDCCISLQTEMWMARRA